MFKETVLQTVKIVQSNDGNQGPSNIIMELELKYAWPMFQNDIDQRHRQQQMVR